MYAVRNIEKCTKDCVCLFVCPTGATDTETGQIDKEKCIGCGKCAKACPSHAILMLPKKYPDKKVKDEEVINKMKKLAHSKIKQEIVATEIKNNSKDKIEKQLAEAVEKSNRIMLEDIYREIGYMIPQDNNVKTLLETMLKQPQSDFPKEKVEKLLEIIKFNE